MPKYRFDEIAINNTQKRIPSEDDRLTYVGLEHLDNGCLRVERWGSEVPLKGEKLVMKKGDVLLGKRNAYLRRAAIAPHDGIFSAHGMVLNPIEKVIDKDFFPLFIASDYFFDRAIKISVGSLSPTVNWKDIRVEEFEIPELETQREVAKTLWGIYEVISKYRELLRVTDELLSAQFVDMFYTHGYPEIKLGKVLHQVTKNEKIVDTLNEKYVTVSLYGKGVRERSIDTHDPKPFTGYRVKAGQFIYSRIDARNGAFGIIPDELDNAVVSKDFPVFEIDRDAITESILLYYMQDVNFMQQIKNNSLGTTNRQRIKEDVFLNYSIVLPPIEKQIAFENILKKGEESKEHLINGIEDLTALYKKILASNLGENAQ